MHVKKSKGKKVDLDHNGIKARVRARTGCVCACVCVCVLTGWRALQMELIGQIEMFHDRGNTFSFISLEKDLEPAGHLGDERTWNFEFKQVEKQVRVAHEWMACRAGVAHGDTPAV